MAETTRSANTMKISFRILWEIKVDDNVDGLNIYTTSEEIWTVEISKMNANNKRKEKE
jgi:hypothetical protein